LILRMSYPRATTDFWVLLFCLQPATPSQSVLARLPCSPCPFFPPFPQTSVTSPEKRPSPAKFEPPAASERFVFFLAQSSVFLSAHIRSSIPSVFPWTLLQTQDSSIPDRHVGPLFGGGAILRAGLPALFNRET